MYIVFDDWERNYLILFYIFKYSFVKPVFFIHYFFFIQFLPYSKGLHGSILKYFSGSGLIKYFLNILNYICGKNHEIKYLIIYITIIAKYYLCDNISTINVFLLLKSGLYIFIRNPVRPSLHIFVKCFKFTSSSHNVFKIYKPGP